MLSWYWLLLLVGLVLRDTTLVFVSLMFAGLRTALGLVQRVLTKNRILPIDLLMPFLFDFIGAVFLLTSFGTRRVTWRGITYEMNRDGRIKAVVGS
jgi:hypothetical protein